MKNFVYQPKIGFTNQILGLPGMFCDLGALISLQNDLMILLQNDLIAMA